MSMSERVPAYEGTEAFLFVSYAHLNTKEVYPVLERLFADKYRVWYDEGIAPGSEWPKNIEDHLRKASAVIVFVSPQSLKSPNCENEVVNANIGRRPVIQYALGNEKHRLLLDCPTVSDYDALCRELDSELIGDGISGYERSMGVAKKGNFWTGVIALALCLSVLLGIGIYGLNAGWFDEMLPGLSPEEVSFDEGSEIIQTENNMLTHIVMQQTNQDLTKEIPFESEEARTLLYEAVGFDRGKTETALTYEDLTACPIETVYFDNPNDEVLSYMQYFPRLTVIEIDNGEKLSSLEPLLSCANLKELYLSYSTFPVYIPKDAAFTVLFRR